MKGKVVKAGLFGLLALALIVLPLIGACAPPEEPEAPPEEPPEVEKPSTVKVAYIGDLTGPYAAVGPPLIQGWTEYMEMVNQRGGIDGVPIQALWADTKAEAPLATAAYKRFKAQGVLCVSCMVTPIGLALQGLLNEDKIPGINQAATLSFYFPPQDYMWCHGGVNTDYELACLYYFDTELWDREAWGTWTLGWLAHDNPFALGGGAGMYKYADTYGVNLVKPEVVALGTLDYSANIMRLVDAGANVIMVDSLGSASGLILKQMGELGVIATSVEEAATVPGKIVPFFGYTSYYVTAMAGAEEYFKYTYGARGYAADWEEEYPGVKEWRDFMLDKYGQVPDPKKGGTDLREGWHNAMVMVAAIERALEAVGWENLNGETLMEYGLKELSFDARGYSAATGYADYEGDRINLQSFALAAYNEEHGDFAAITPYLNIPETLPECEVTDYMTTQGGPGWYTP